MFLYVIHLFIAKIAYVILQADLADIRKPGGDRVGRAVALSLWQLFGEKF